MHITAWWGWVLAGGGAIVVIAFIWLLCVVIHFLLHLLDGW